MLWLKTQRKWAFDNLSWPAWYLSWSYRYWKCRQSSIPRRRSHERWDRLPSPRITSSAVCCAAESAPFLRRKGLRSSFLWELRCLSWFAGSGGLVPSLRTAYCDLLVLFSLYFLLLLESHLHWVVQLCVCFALELTFMRCLRSAGFWYEWLLSI